MDVATGIIACILFVIQLIVFAVTFTWGYRGLHSKVLGIEKSLSVLQGKNGLPGGRCGEHQASMDRQQERSNRHSDAIKKLEQELDNVKATMIVVATQAQTLKDHAIRIEDVKTAMRQIAERADITPPKGIEALNRSSTKRKGASE